MTHPLRRPLLSVFSLLIAGGCLLLPSPLTAEMTTPAAMETSTRKIDNLTRLLTTIEHVKTEVVEAQSNLSSPASLGKE
ncbi:hypothetical protein [Desulfoluna sp.]|uniref:hypothetical protein n=1 Tax=Desulfoluna sp. TaxID=2045199 RepID=UPI0026299D0D|nr:hypothetical protein [Desulfoluna sp.]